MAFTTATITHIFEAADDSVPTGEVTFALSKRMTNNGTTLLPSEITSALDVSGHLSQVLTSTNDQGTDPGDALWVVTVRITGPQPLIIGPYAIAVPTGGGSFDLFSLLPQNQIGNG